jgi:hypothetical protein
MGGPVSSQPQYLKPFLGRYPNLAAKLIFSWQPSNSLGEGEETASPGSMH